MVMTDIGIVFRTKANTTYTHWYSQSEKLIDLEKFGDETHLCILNILHECSPNEHDKPLFVVHQNLKKW